MSFPLALLLVGLAGFISLSYEILWYRVFSFTTQGSPATFGIVLGFFLLGIALGSLASRRYCKDRTDASDPAILRPIAVFVFLANLVGWLVIPLLARLLGFTNWGWALPAVALAAGLLGATFPLISHFGIPPDDQAGARLSYLYMSNIAGSAGGSLLTGFVLMDHFSLETIALMLALAGIAMAAGLLIPAKLRGSQLAFGLAGSAAAVALVVGLTPALFDRVYERLLWRKRFEGTAPFAKVIETRSGVITVTEDGSIFGGGAYDGAFSTDLVHDRNQIIRPYALSAIHAAPRKVLMIGLSSGSWAQVLASNPEVEALTIVEINPGYLQLIAEYPQVASLLTNPKVDHRDRRRPALAPAPPGAALRRRGAEHHLALARPHHEPPLRGVPPARPGAPGGRAALFYFNTTFSEDAQKTACTVFPHALRLRNFMAVSDAPLALDRERWRRVLLAYRLDGKPIFDPASSEDEARLESVLVLADSLDKLPPYQGTESRESVLRRVAAATVITDDNMVNEWHNALKR